MTESFSDSEARPARERSEASGSVSALPPLHVSRVVGGLRSTAVAAVGTLAHGKIGFVPAAAAAAAAAAAELRPRSNMPATHSGLLGRSRSRRPALGDSGPDHPLL